MVNNKIMSRRKRAQIGTILAILMILLPLPAGAYIYSGMSGYGDSTVCFNLDDEVDDSIFSAEFVDYDNATGVYTYSKETSNEVLLSNYTTDLAAVTLSYHNSSGDAMSADLGFSAESSGKIFTMLEQSGSDVDSSFTFNSGVAEYPRVTFITPVSPSDLLDSGSNSFRVYWENNQEMNATIVVGVYDEDSTPDSQAGLAYVSQNGVSSDGGVVGNYDITHLDIVTDVNGSWSTIEIPETKLLEGASTHGDGYVFVTIIDIDGDVLDETNGILFDFEIIGSESPFSLTSIWQGCLIATGLISLIGAVLATPYIGLESFSNDGAGGDRYRKGANPRPNRSKSGSKKSYPRRK